MTSAVSTIAAVVGADSLIRQALLAATVAAWRGAGVKVAGVIAEPERRPGSPCSAGILRNIVSGQPVSIYLDTAPSNTVCHLDAASVGTACAGGAGRVDGPISGGTCRTPVTPSTPVLATRCLPRPKID